MLSVPVQVLPRYWQTTWFAIVVLTLLARLLLAGLRWRTRQLRNQDKGRCRRVDVSDLAEWVGDEKNSHKAPACLG